MKKYVFITGAVLIIALVFYLGVKSEKILESIGVGGGLIGIIAALFHKHTGSRNKSGRTGKSVDISITELKDIRKRYRQTNRKIQNRLYGSQHEVDELRKSLERDRERIKGYESAGSGIRKAGDRLDELIRRIQEEGIDS